ncbi:replication initiator protein [Microvirus mar12]|uniref:Replication initiator protein n=1 Tax=Microvirus mar12 TaxID=2851144 RepID=A0A8F5MKG7_9VIRU|nr:replication initiator protein [Microvirus mar12]
MSMCLSPILFLNPRKIAYKVLKTMLRSWFDENPLKYTGDFASFMREFITDRGFLSQRGREAVSRAGLSDHIQELPCRTCLECRMQNARQWTARCQLEARAHKSNYFVTLTYDDDHVPKTPDGLLTLCYRDFQLFMKSLRKQIDYSVRYRVCSEYGERTRRPHYHAIIFGLELSDLRWLYSVKHGRKIYRSNGGGVPHYTSPWLAGIWARGNVDIAAVEFGSISYVNNYMLKYELGGKQDDWKMLEEFRSSFPQQNACYRSAVKLGIIAPPKHNQSTRPAIGRCAFEECEQQLLETDQLPTGLKLRVKYLHYFDRLLFEKHPEIKIERQRMRANLARAVDYDIGDKEEERKKRGERLAALVKRRYRPL